MRKGFPIYLVGLALLSAPAASWTESPGRPGELVRRLS